MTDKIYVCNLDGEEPECVWDATNEWDPATDCVMSCAGVKKAECEHWVAKENGEND